MLLRHEFIISDEKFSLVCYKSTREEKSWIKLKIIFIVYKKHLFKSKLK